MSAQHEGKGHNQENDQNHDDCDDCRLEQAQNQLLINMYEKLQDVDKKSVMVRQNLVKHKDFIQADKDKLSNFQSKVQNIKNSRNNSQLVQFQKMGYNLYIDLLQASLKAKKQIQSRRYSAKKLQPKLQLVHSIEKNAYKNQESTVFFKKGKLNLSKSFNIYSNQEYPDESKWFNTAARVNSRNCENLKKNTRKASYQVTSTKSTFNNTKRRSLQKHDYKDLNLWLFEDRNQQLEQQLYSQKVTDSAKIDCNQKVMKTKHTTNNKMINNRKTGKFNEIKDFDVSQFSQNSHRRRSSLKECNKNKNLKCTLQNIGSSIQMDSQDSKQYFSRRQKGSALPAISKT